MLVIDKFLDYIYNIVVILAMIYSLYLWVKKGYTAKQKYFFVYLVIVFIVDVIGFEYIRKAFNIHQTYLFFPFIIFSILYFRYFYIQDYKTKKDHYFLNAIAAISIGMSLYFQFSIGFPKFNNNVFLMMILFFLLASLQWFLYIIRFVDEQNITVKQSFWVSFGILFWSIFALFRLYLGTWLYSYNQDIFSVINLLFNVFNIFMYIFFIKGLRCVDYNVLRTFNSFKK
ncbi:hypothetical protein [Cloacibacterium normanense]|uniref:hypothetical protein n=1 Tax=Cloacibacterium normanense TaxID=237258 RepID=UPI00391DD3A3